MKILVELASLNTKQKRVVDSLIPNEENSPLKKLFDLVSVEPSLDDESAMIEIYGKKNITAFARLKARLKDILMRTIMLQNQTFEASDSRTNEILNGYRTVMFVRQLIVLKSFHLGIALAEKAIVRSMKYHDTENVLLHARMLVEYYGRSNYNKYKLNKYLSIQKKYLLFHQWEIKAENYYHDLQRTQLNSLANASEETKAKAKKYMLELDSVPGIRTYFFNLNKYRVKSAYYEYAKDYNSLLHISNQAIKEFGVLEFKAGSALSSIHLRKVYALIQAGRNEETIALGKKDLLRIPPGSPSWFFMAHYTLKAQLYKGDYIDSIHLISEVINHPKFLNMGDNYKELFNTTLGYIHLIVYSGIAGNPIDINTNLPEFKLGKYLNTTPVFSKDKRGINVSILLMHVAFLLQRKDYNAIIDRVDSLNQYAYRYLRKDDSFRSNCMIKMVIQMTKADFNPIRTERYTQELLAQLQEVKLAGSGENIETEIIPYELLWQIMTKSL